MSWMEIVSSVRAQGLGTDQDGDFAERERAGAVEEAVVSHRAHLYARPSGEEL